MSRTRRRPYTKSKRFDRSCRNHGSCPWCRANRTFQERRAKASADAKLSLAGMSWSEERLVEGGWMQSGGCHALVR